MNLSRIWAADFETTTDETDCRVWAWGVANLLYPDQVSRGTDIQSFFDYCMDQELRMVYFHNLKFDGRFIVDYLFKNGYTWTKERDPGAMEFTTLISDMGQWYNIIIGMPFDDYGYSFIMEIRDSLKIIPMSVEEMPGAFGLEENKLELDYNAMRDEGHQLTKQEIEYLNADVIILAKSLVEMLKGGQTRLTTGSNALNFLP